MNFSLEITLKTDLSILPKVKDVYITMLPGNDFKESERGRKGRSSPTPSGERKTKSLLFSAARSDLHSRSWDVFVDLRTTSEYTRNL